MYYQPTHRLLRQFPSPSTISLTRGIENLIMVYREPFKGNRRMEREKFTLFDITRGFDFKREGFRSWLKKGYIKPSIQTATGPGRAADTKNLFSRLDLYGIALFWFLSQKMKLPLDDVAKIVNPWLEEVSYWTEAAGMDDTQIRALLTKCNIITVRRYPNFDFVLEAQEFLDETRNKVCKGYSDKHHKPFGIVPPKAVKFDGIYKNTQKLLHEELTNPAVKAPWFWVLHINFAKMREEVDKLFP
jgi:hypothetical protein